MTSAPAGRPVSSWLGRLLSVDIGPVAHGGHCVARHEGRVIFVRHALPGERARVRITEDSGGSFCRGDAVEIEQPSADRVTPPCRFAGPARCGGCDFQHVALSAQRALKAQVVTEQLQRLAGLNRSVEVQALPRPADGDEEDGLRWRRRVRFSRNADGELGLRVHRSHDVIPVDDCLIGAVEFAAVTLPTGKDRAEYTAAAPDHATEPSIEPPAEVEYATDGDGTVAVIGLWPLAPGRGRRGRQARDRQRTVAVQLAGPRYLTYPVGPHRYRVHSGGFWQNHPAAAARFSEAVLAACQVIPGDRVLDLYAGAGLFTVPLAQRAAPGGAVVGVEGDSAAVADAEFNAFGLPTARIVHSRVDATVIGQLATELGGVDVVVLDPPRSGAGAEVVRAVLELRPRVVVYVACDPAALARDVRTAVEAGWELTDIAAFDAFPMTHHVECIATLLPQASPTARERRDVGGND